jgi:TolA-binding protein
MALKMPTLATAFYGEIVQRFPGTDAAKKASEALAK